MTERIDLHEVLSVFEQICEIYRPSGQEDTMRAFLCDWAKEHDYVCRRDDYGNISIQTKPGKPQIALQAHMDMVLVFEKWASCIQETFTGICTDIRDGKLFSLGSSLGADNGIAIAYMLVAARAFPEMNIELVFTVDEERWLVGAHHLDGDIIASDYLLNLDNEMNHEICIATCGIAHWKLQTHAPKKELSQTGEYLEIELSGMKGWHSGTDIHTGHGNAIRELAQLIESYPSELVLIAFTGGVADNAIPQDAKAVVYIDDRENFEQHVKASEQQLQQKYAVGKIELSEVSVDHSQAYDWLPLLRAIHATKDAVYAWDDDGVYPETSSNLARVCIQADTANVLYSIRSPKQDAIDEMMAYFEKSYGAPGESKIHTHGWKADDSCSFIAFIEQSMKKLSDEVYRAPIHASLEVGAIQANKPNLQVASIGPMIHYPHSIHEHIYLDDIELYCKYLSQILDDISQLDFVK